MCIFVHRRRRGVAQWLMSVIRRHRGGLDQITGYERLRACIESLSKLGILPFDREAALVFHQLERSRLRIGTMGLKIAAICIAHDALLLSRNLVDFEKVPGLRVENCLD
jgi:tRNA(fMet)-specific endonuclease VapC